MAVINNKGNENLNYTNFKNKPTIAYDKSVFLFLLTMKCILILFASCL